MAYANILSIMVKEMTQDKIPLCKSEITSEELEAIGEVLKSGWLAHGPRVKQFEEDFAKYTGVEHAVSVNSCASALQASLMAANLMGKEVIVPSFTFVASANAIVNAGCKPVFAEVDQETCNLDVNDLECRLTRETGAIMPVHFAGQSCSMDDIVGFASANDLQIIEDSAETIGGLHHGRKVGTFGIGCFSFYPTKNITTGEGGMVTTNDPELAEKVRTIRGHGISKGAFDRQASTNPWDREAVLPGYNFRMCDILAAMGIVQLRKVDLMNRRRRENAITLTEGLREVEGLRLPVEAEGNVHVYQMYTIRVDGVNRDSFVHSLRNRGVEASVHFSPPVHLHSFYKDKFGYKRGDLPITEQVAKDIVTLPMYPSLTKPQIEKMVGVIREEITKNRK